MSCHLDTSDNPSIIRPPIGTSLVLLFKLERIKLGRDINRASTVLEDGKTSGNKKVSKSGDKKGVSTRYMDHSRGPFGLLEEMDKTLVYLDFG